MNTVNKAIRLLENSKYLIGLPSVVKNALKENPDIIKAKLEEFINIRNGNLSLYIKHTYSGNIIFNTKLNIPEYLVYRIQSKLINKIILYRIDGTIIDIKNNRILNKNGKV